MLNFPLLDDFLVRAGLAAVGVALPAGALGSFVVWRRMAYFGDATAHAALLGVALALALQVPVGWGVLAIAIGMSVMLTGLSDARLGADALLGVLSHGALAIGVLAVALTPGARIDLEALLFGDVLVVGRGGLAAIWAAAAAILAVIAWRWRALLLVTLSPELASAAGHRPARESSDPGAAAGTLGRGGDPRRRRASGDRAPRRPGGCRPAALALARGDGAGRDGAGGGRERRRALARGAAGCRRRPGDRRGLRRPFHCTGPRARRGARLGRPALRMFSKYSGVNWPPGQEGQSP